MKRGFLRQVMQIRRIENRVPNVGVLDFMQPGKADCIFSKKRAHRPEVSGNKRVLEFYAEFSFDSVDRVRYAGRQRFSRFGMKVAFDCIVDRGHAETADGIRPDIKRQK